MALQSTLMQLVLHVQAGAQGWAEKYYLPDADYTPALDRGERIVAYRQASLAPPCEICWARVSFVGKPREALAVPGLPLTIRKYVGIQATDINDVWTAKHFRQETANGRWANRLLRGIGDDVVVKGKHQYDATSRLQPWPANLPLLDLTDVSQIASNMFRCFLRILVDDTIYAKSVGTAQAPSFEVFPWLGVTFRKIAKRDTGVPFGITRGRAPAEKQVVQQP